VGSGLGLSRTWEHADDKTVMHLDFEKAEIDAQ
jgi:hypothetical protein